ncbi:MAG: hypothetical protein O7E54_04105 [Planctomycetota bacterium]|nr:hypothetical protein [Planctomycetota bacterium]
MISPTLSASLGLLWLAIGGTAVVLMLRVYGQRVPTKGRLALVKAHRRLGRAFTSIYVVFLWVMFQKILSYSTFTPLQAVHMAVGISLLPILGTKILIVRRYPVLHGMLPALGLTVFSLSVVIVFLGAMPFFVAKITAPDTEGLEQEELVAAGGTLLEQRCQKCHDLDRIYDLKGRKSKELWEVSVDKMVRLDPALADVRTPILAFLQAEFAAPETATGTMLTGSALVEARCAKCHSLDRVFGYTKTEEQWELTVRRYAELLPDHIHPSEIEPIVKYLFEKRGAPPDPEAAKRKLFEQQCGRCHNLSRALDRAHESKVSPRRWKRTLRRMKTIAEERGLDIWTDEEAGIIAEYLAAQYQEGSEED